MRKRPQKGSVSLRNSLENVGKYLAKFIVVVPFALMGCWIFLTCDFFDKFTIRHMRTVEDTQIELYRNCKHFRKLLVNRIASFPAKEHTGVEASEDILIFFSVAV
jgi:hypothetical protein